MTEGSACRDTSQPVQELRSPAMSDLHLAANASPPNDRSVASSTLIASPTPTELTTSAHSPTALPRVQNHAALQRSSSVIQGQASVLSRSLSVKSNGSNGSRDPGSSILATMHTVEEAEVKKIKDGISGIVADSNESSLQKSLSVNSNRSARSYISLRGIGNIPIGNLRIHSPSPVRVSATELHPVLKEGDIFVVRDVPAGVVVGYDTKVISIKEKGNFDGIKHLPPGVHLIWASSGITSLRTGYWIITSEKNSDQYGDIFVRSWDQYNEVLDQIGSRAETMNQRQSISEYVDSLHAYDLSVSALKKDSELDVWRSLTSCIKGSSLELLFGSRGNGWAISSTHDYKRDKDLVLDVKSSLDVKKDEVLRFVFPKDSQTFLPESRGRDRTEQAIDTTAHVIRVIDNCKNEDSDQIIGELQFCFLTGMILGNSACQEHWALVVKVVFQAVKLAVANPNFFEKFIRTVHAQLIYDETAFEGSSILDIESNLRNELKVILTIFKSRLDEQLLAQDHHKILTKDQMAVGDAFSKFEAWLWRWEWDLRGNYLRKGNVQLEDGTVVEDLELQELEAEDERGEYAPQIVELDEEGREIGLICF